MSMNTNDPNQIPAAQATTEPSVQKSEAPKQPAPEQPEAPKESRSKKVIAIVAVLAVLIAGLGTAITLMVKGALDKEKEDESARVKKPETEATSEEPSVESTEKAETEPTSEPETDATTSETEARTRVSKVSMITDEQMKTMQEFAEDFFRTNDATKLPDGVTLDLFNNLGAIIMGFGAADDDGYVYLIYQVHVTDSTGESPVQREYFWLVGFMDVYDDGTIELTTPVRFLDELHFENWSTAGTGSLENIREDFSSATAFIIDDGVDDSLLQPTPGKDAYEPVKRELVTEISMVTERQLLSMQVEADHELMWNNIPQDGEVTELRFLGTMLGVKDDDTRFYLVYEVHLTTGSGEEAEEYQYYWYIGFYDVYQRGELNTTYRMLADTCMPIGDVDYSGFKTLDELIDAVEVRHNATDLVFEENIDRSLVTKNPMTEGFIFPSSDTILLEDQQITDLSDEKLRAAINEIWARHGYIFRDKDLLDYYRQFAWYEETVSADEWDKNGQEYYLNDIEMENIKKLMKERDSRS